LLAINIEKSDGETTTGILRSVIIVCCGGVVEGFSMASGPGNGTWGTRK